MGTFLEHSRIFYFENAGKSEVYIAAVRTGCPGTWNAVEILFPVEDPKLKEKVLHILDAAAGYGEGPPAAAGRQL